jgi:hypothetical protein
MKTIQLKSFSEFEERAAKQMHNSESFKQMNICWHDALYRGHGCEKWKLETTLERAVRTHVTIYAYYRIMLKNRPIIESYTNKSWKDLPPASEFTHERFGGLLGYDLMVHLRHHGFPSPLLDWSASPFVAAFFAFQHEHSTSSNVAIYAFQEYAGTPNVGYEGRPRVIALGPYVNAPKRHFIQHSQYTICEDESPLKEGTFSYGNHEDAFDTSNDKGGMLVKFLIPRTERLAVLKRLDKMNINAHTLFDDQNSLMEMLSNREFLFEFKLNEYNRLS